MLFELNIESDLRFPTRKTLDKILTDTDTDYHGWASTDKYKLASRFFPIVQTTDTEIVMGVVKNSHESGMTYFHAPGTEPRTWDSEWSSEVYETRWKGAHFKEGFKFSEKELIELGNKAPSFRNVKIQERIAEGLRQGIERRKRRLEWMAAQILTTGQLVVTRNLPDNPEGLTFTVDYMFDNFTLTPVDFTHKDINGESTVDPVKWAVDLRNAAKDDVRVPGKYKPVELIVTDNFARVLRENTLFWKAWYGFTNRDINLDPTPLYFYSDEAIIDGYKRMTGLQITVYEAGFQDRGGAFTQYIPDDGMVIVYSGGGQFANFTMTAHVHTDGEKLTLGTGPYVIVDDGRKNPNPYWATFTGFHGLNRVLDYDPKTLKCHRVKYQKYA